MRVGISIDQLSRPAPGGIGTYIHGLRHGLSELVTPPTVVPFGSTSSRLADRLQTLAWVNSDRGVPAHLDVVHATSLAGPFGTTPHVRRTIMLQDLLWREEPATFTVRGRKFHELRYLKVVQRSDIAVMVTTPRLAQQVVDSGVTADRVHLVTLGLDLNPPPVDVDQVRERLGLHEPFIVAVGTSEPRKNIARMIAAWRLARERFPHIPRLVIVGWSGWGTISPDPDVTWLHNLATSDVRALQSAASIAAYIPLREGWGLPPLEALSFGTRVLASSTVPSVEGRSDVVTVDPLDVDSIAKGILSAMELSTDERDRAARRDSVAGLTWRAMAEQHLGVWQ